MMETPEIVPNVEKAIAHGSAPDVGKMLREARETLGLSVHDIANRIKFAPRQVEALEANDFAHLPQATFLRGFVRSYARVLQLDEAELIAALPTEQVKHAAVKAPVVDVAFPSILSLQRVNLLWLAGALGVGLVLGLFLLMHESEPIAKSSDVVVESVPLPNLDVAASGVTDTEVQLGASEVERATESVMVNEPIKVVQPVLAPVPQSSVVSAPEHVVKPAAVVVKPSAAAEALKRRPLHFVFGEAMWAEVTDAHGAVLLSRDVPRGSEKWIGGPGHAPYKISVSNPRNVKLFYQGKEIDLTPYAAMDMAHFKVK
jgi:cytoskeleton protein RodZ